MYSLFERMKKVDLGKWVASWPTSRKGGVIGVFVCMLLLGIYVVAFTIPNSFIMSIISVPMLLTGHAFLISSAFYFQNGINCPLTIRECTERGGFPAECTNWILRPEYQCVQNTRWIGFIGVVLLLNIIYYFIGAGIAIYYEKIKSKKL